MAGIGVRPAASDPEACGLRLERAPARSASHMFLHAHGPTSVPDEVTDLGNEGSGAPN